jgi:hypothetical protein
VLGGGLRWIFPRFTRLRSRWAVEHGQKNTSTCSTRPERARARPAPDPARPAPRQATPVPTPIKPAEVSAVLPHTLSTSPEQEITGASPTVGVPAAACWGLVLKCYELRTRQHKMLNDTVLRPWSIIPLRIVGLGRRLMRELLRSWTFVINFQ